MSKKLSLTGVLKKLLDNSNDSHTSLGELIEQLESRGFGPLLLVPSLIGLLPTGAIPGIPTACGICIFLIAIQLCIGDERPWLPKRIEQISISRDKLQSAIKTALPYTQKIDAVSKPRLDWLMYKWVKRIVAFMCGATGLLMIPLEILPFAAALPAFAVALSAVGFTTQDGVAVCLGIMASLGSLFLVYSQVF